MMYTKLIEKTKADSRIIQVIKANKKQAYRKLCAYALLVFAVAILLCLSAKLNAFGWLITLLCAVMAVAAPVFFLVRKKEAKIFVGKIERMEENREIVPRKGSGAIFGTSHKYALDEVYKLLIAITNENQETEVIFCSPQYEKILKIGDTLLTHSALPYPAHLSNPTKCICMHCGTMQASENLTCITCGANIYSIHQLTKLRTSTTGMF